VQLGSPLPRGRASWVDDQARTRTQARFFPRYADEKEASPAILDVVRHAPELFDVKQSRWTLKAIAQACPWLRLCTDSGLFQMLKRLKIRYKRARSYIHSPDLFYDEKADELQACLARARTDPDRFVFCIWTNSHIFVNPPWPVTMWLRGLHNPWHV